MSYEAWFRYVPDGPLYPYRLDYATAVEARDVSTWLAANGFWYQQPGEDVAYGTARAVSLATVIGDALILEDDAYLVLEDLVSLVLL